MENSVATIQCSNPNCQALNPLTVKICHKCRTPLIKRYLWSIGDWLSAYRVGELIGDRYLLKTPKIVLDTQPALPPLTPEEVPDAIVPYLKLLPYRLHIPLVYGYLPSPDEQLDLNIWFLEYGTVPTNESGELKYPKLFPQLTELWQQASNLRQLNWLWQMARLWEPFHSKGVASSLLEPSLLTVNGSSIQLLELKFDEERKPSLQQLGQLWSQWLDRASPQLSEYLQHLCQHLEQGKIERSEQLLTLLEDAIAQSDRVYERTYQIYTRTDAGPTRDHNEDACYPYENELVKINGQEKALAIVCDGIGGQEGGEIASQLAIDSLREEIARIEIEEDKSQPQCYLEAIESAICTTNDLISKRNDSENRQERQRMGTTLVMSLACDRDIYLAHIGDSRIYWITPTSCQQATVDDDLASREVRLGYLLYREAIQYPNAGALVQALGMNSSSSLHPTVQRFIVDEDCVFLLCSDGLSDFDRVDQYWESEIVPIVNRTKDVTEVGKRLLEIANTRNGHDNVTIALVYCQVKLKEGVELPTIVYPEIDVSDVPSPTLLLLEDEEEIQKEEEDTVLMGTSAKSESYPEKTSQRSPFSPVLLSVVALGALALGGGYWLWQKNIQSQDSNPPTLSALVEGDAIETLTPISLQASQTEVDRSLQVPAGIILKVVSTNSNSLELRTCQISQNVNSNPEEKKRPGAIALGQQGWIDREKLALSVVTKLPSADEVDCSVVESPQPIIPPKSPSPETDN
ncbi:serine/threonine-protein phosphatase [Candidatus Gracilibacteria bacterium]|nr:serine/threonine-protein phosphatase [Candidatus Gracilibacteria bacterium]NJM87520.1 serine/threonine-protein phosphatase [Hydrococcus sp. RU_2_2]NJP18131.1 serine/threonine-protein phosphatase [Hydrococcus sp. CRU_1_1]